MKKINIWKDQSKIWTIDKNKISTHAFIFGAIHRLEQLNMGSLTFPYQYFLIIAYIDDTNGILLIFLKSELWFQAEILVNLGKILVNPEFLLPFDWWNSDFQLLNFLVKNRCILNQFQHLQLGQIHVCLMFVLFQDDLKHNLIAWNMIWLLEIEIDCSVVSKFSDPKTYSFHVYKFWYIAIVFINPNIWLLCFINTETYGSHVPV